MCRLGPDGYGSISSWYQWFSAVGSPGTGFGTLKARSSSQTRCHFVSISWGSYLGVIGKSSPGDAEGVSPGLLAGRPRLCRGRFQP